MIANLPMYDRPETALHNEIFWLSIRAALGFGPDRLTRTEDLWSLWKNEHLVLGQTCGLAYWKCLFDKVHDVATPDYGLNACPEGYYKSIFISHKKQDLAKASEGIFAFNGPLSQSGWAGPMCHLEALDLCPNAVCKTGSHANSAHAIAEKRADFAAIDAQTWRIIRAHDPMAKTLFVIGETSAVRGLPFICSKRFDPFSIFCAIKRAILNLEEKAQQALFLKGVIRIDPKRYLEMPSLQYEFNNTNFAAV